MDIWIIARFALAALFLGAAALKMPRAQGLTTEFSQTLRLASRAAQAAAIVTVGVEVSLAAGLAWTPTSRDGSLLGFVWSATAVAYGVFAILQGSAGCGCLGGFDPLLRLGATRRLVYAAPFALLSSILVAHQIVAFGAEAESTVVKLVAIGLIPLALAGTILTARRVHSRAAWDVTPGFESRRGFLIKAASLALGGFFLPLLNVRPVLADTCGAWVCKSVWQICGCCTCSGNQSCSSLLPI